MNLEVLDKIFIAFIVKSNKKIGYGHFMRCGVLSEKFQQMIKCNIRFFPKIFLNKISNFDICITDLPDIKEKELEQLKKYSKLLASIDDGHKIKFSSDILINPNINPKIKNHFSKKTKYFSGKDYIILKEEFEKFAKKTKIISKKPKQIFVCFGGSDSNNLTERLIKILKKIKFDKKIKINLIVGSLFGNARKIEKLIKHSKQYILHRNTSDLTKILWQSDLAIISGGTLMYEACVLGIPTIVICQNREQNEEGKFFAKNKAIINLGVFDDINKNKASKIILKLNSDYRRRKLLSKNAKHLIPIKGANRIVGVILKEYFKRYA